MFWALLTQGVNPEERKGLPKKKVPPAVHDGQLKGVTPAAHRGLPMSKIPRIPPSDFKGGAFMRPPFYQRTLEAVHL